MVRLSALLAEDPARCNAEPAPPAPSTWFMESVEPNLTPRMLNELSPSLIPATGADRYARRMRVSWINSPRHDFHLPGLLETHGVGAVAAKKPTSYSAADEGMTERWGGTEAVHKLYFCTGF